MNNSDRTNQENKQAKSSQPLANRILEVKWAYRWEVFRRLQDLGIECRCSTNEPLFIYLHSPITAIQIWSVLRQTSMSRDESIDWLENCWEIRNEEQIRRF